MSQRVIILEGVSAEHHELGFFSDIWNAISNTVSSVTHSISSAFDNTFGTNIASANLKELSFERVADAVRSGTYSFSKFIDDTIGTDLSKVNLETAAKKAAEVAKNLITHDYTKDTFFEALEHVGKKSAELWYTTYLQPNIQAAKGTKVITDFIKDIPGLNAALLPITQSLDFMASLPVDRPPDKWNLNDVKNMAIANMASIIEYVAPNASWALASLPNAEDVVQFAEKALEIYNEGKSIYDQANEKITQAREIVEFARNPDRKLKELVWDNVIPPGAREYINKNEAVLKDIASGAVSIDAVKRVMASPDINRLVNEGLPPDAVKNILRNTEAAIKKESDPLKWVEAMSRALELEKKKNWLEQNVQVKPLDVLQLIREREAQTRRLAKWQQAEAAIDKYMKSRGLA